MNWSMKIKLIFYNIKIMKMIMLLLHLFYIIFITLILLFGCNSLEKYYNYYE